MVLCLCSDPFTPKAIYPRRRDSYTASFGDIPFISVLAATTRVASVINSGTHLGFSRTKTQYWTDVCLEQTILVFTVEHLRRLFNDIPSISRLDPLPRGEITNLIIK